MKRRIDSDQGVHVLQETREHRLTDRFGLVVVSYYIFEWKWQTKVGRIKGTRFRDEVQGKEGRSAIVLSRHQDQWYKKGTVTCKKLK